jgi:hypothetical protein
LRPGRIGPPGHFALKAGTRVQVKHCASSYPLPAGLEPGDWVKIFAFDTGYYAVEKDRLPYSIFMANIVENRPKEKGSGTANRRSHSLRPELKT